jgi:hypothetical protein
MLIVTIQETKLQGISLRTWDKFVPNAARVIELEADNDELEVILEQFPFLYNGKRVQTFTDNVAKMIMVFWQQKYN